MKTLLTTLLSLFCIHSILAQENVGIGIQMPEARLHIEGDSVSVQPALRTHVKYSGFVDIPAIHATSITEEGYGYGGTFEGGWIGARAIAYGGSYTGIAYGIQGFAYGDSGTRIGVYGSALGGAENWAGYFEGRGKFTDALILDQNLEVNGPSDFYGDGLFWDNASVSDTLFSSRVYTPFWLVQEAGYDVQLTIDRFDDPGYTAVFKVTNGANANVFAADENGNARTYGEHYVDERLGVGTQFPSQQLDVDNGDLVVQGPNSFQTAGDRGTVYLGSIHHYITGEYGYGVKIGTYAVGDAIGINELTGNVCIGTMTPANGYKLSVDGKIMGEELKIQNSTAWPDYVFEENYALMPLEELGKTIKTQGHLPGIPSAREVDENGIMVGDMQRRMMEKIEELTLYMLELHQDIEDLKQKNASLEARLQGQK